MCNGTTSHLLLRLLIFNSILFSFPADWPLEFFGCLLSLPQINKIQSKLITMSPANQSKAGNGSLITLNTHLKYHLFLISLILSFYLLNLIRLADHWVITFHGPVSPIILSPAFACAMSAIFFTPPGPRHSTLLSRCQQFRCQPCMYVFPFTD